MDRRIADKISMAGLGMIAYTMLMGAKWSIQDLNSAMRKGFLLVFILLAATAARAQTWKPLGPPGGDVRALAADPARPSRIFLGTADGHIFASEDSGAHWTLLGRASSRLDAVITAIVVDPREGNVLFASSWTRDTAAGGGVFRSGDGGRTWSGAGLAGQAVRALAMAPSDPNVLVAGTLDGVYRSLDASKSWERISPEHHEELRNFDSLAIDPRDPQTLYAGTFHLPWKTTDGGRTWHPIHEGMIDDSDVMSLLIDQGNSRRIYASACSGIYRSDDSAAQWGKIQGIPYTARRTYAITQDPKLPASVYAATSEGLWKTPDGGMRWRRTTPESWVVNTVVVAEGNPGRVLIGTEELGVLASDDGGEHFQDANVGFNHRQILALGLDAKRPGRVLAVLAHAPEPILTTEDDGRTWSPLEPGLRAEKALRVYAAPDDAWWVSLARGGLMRYDAGEKAWKQVGTVAGEDVARHAVPLPSNAGVRKSIGKKKNGPQPLQVVVTDMAFSSKKWYAATSSGLLTSTDRGATWTRKPVGPLTSLPVQSVRVSSNGKSIRVVSLRGLVFSEDGGNSWTWHDLPLNSGGAVTLDAQPGDENTLIAIARKGLYISRDAGKIWQQAASGLPSTPVQDFAATGGLFVASMRTGGLYVSSDSGWTWDRIPGTLADGFFAAVAPSNEPGVIFAASTTEGLYRVEWPGSTAGRAAFPDQSRKLTAREEASPGN
jgi:photosystem II stability/assembly factor-like uncharacterized protein